MTAVPANLRLRRESTLRSRAARGDAAAFAAVYERHHQDLYRYCRSILRHEEDAQDALQSTMTRAFAALQDEQRDFELRPWLFRIAHNEAISILRKRRTTTELDDIPIPADLEDRVSEREELRLLQMDLADLPDRQRAALVLRELNGLSHAEIAVVLETSAANVKQTIYEARSALFSAREGREMPCDDVRRMLSDGDGRVLRGRGVRAHLRSCAGCRRFQADIDQRSKRLAMLAPPLPTAGAAALLAQILGGGGAAKLLACVAIAGGGATVAAVEFYKPPPRAAAEAPAATPRPAPERPAAATTTPTPTSTTTATPTATPGARRTSTKDTPATVVKRDKPTKRTSAKRRRAPVISPAVQDPPGKTRQGEREQASEPAPRATPPGKEAKPDKPEKAKPEKEPKTKPEQSERRGRPDTPPGQAKPKREPPGQSKPDKAKPQKPGKTPATDATPAPTAVETPKADPPGQAKKEAEPPGQAKREGEPPGQAKKQDKGEGADDDG